MTYKVYNEQDVLITTTDEEWVADTMAWMYNGYYLEEGEE